MHRLTKYPLRQFIGGFLLGLLVATLTLAVFVFVGMDH